MKKLQSPEKKKTIPVDMSTAANKMLVVVFTKKSDSLSYSVSNTSRGLSF